MDVGAAVVADEESFELVEPGEGAFDDPAVAAEAGAVRLEPSGDLGADAPLLQFGAAAAGVVGAVGGDPGGLTGHGRDPVDQRDQLGDVVSVAAGHRPGQRHPVAVD